MGETRTLYEEIILNPLIAPFARRPYDALSYTEVGYQSDAVICDIGSGEAIPFDEWAKAMNVVREPDDTLLPTLED